MKNLIPLTEAISVSSSLAIKNKTTDIDKKQLSEAIVSFLKKKGETSRSTLLTESEVKEKANQLIDMVGSGKTKWSFPISRINHINQNNRRYSRKLWEKVIKEQSSVWDRGVGLADHPVGDSDALFKDSAVVWSNLRIVESKNTPDVMVWADAIFVGPYGKLAEEILEAGGRIGFSTAGMGELEKMTETTATGEYREFYEVNPDTFVLERLADLVSNPSQDVYGFLEMKITESKKLKEDEGGAGVTSGDFQAQAPENVINISFIGSKKEKGKEDMENVNTGMTPYEERRYKEDILKFIERAQSLVSPKERLKELEEIKKYVLETPPSFLSDIKKELDEKIDATQKEIEKLYEKGENFQNIFGTNLGVEEVQSTLNELNDMKTVLKESTYDWKIVAEKMAEKLKKFVETVEILRHRPTLESHEVLKERINSVSRELKRKMLFYEKKLLENQKKSKSIEEKLYLYVKENIVEKNKLKEEIRELKERNIQLQKEKARIVEKFEKITKSTLDESTRYLFEGPREVQKEEKKRRLENSRITESALSQARGRDMVEVRNYYDDLLKKHGVKIIPYSSYILEARDYQDAVNRFIKISEKMTPGWDPDLIADLDNPTIWDYISSL